MYFTILNLIIMLSFSFSKPCSYVCVCMLSWSQRAPFGVLREPLQKTPPSTAPFGIVVMRSTCTVQHLHLHVCVVQALNPCTIHRSGYACNLCSSCMPGTS
ncbi:hypothetical protein M758_3G038900 [Ceratodon purpureus]|uniref:Secreted protein n=1 Tax=Ceratodon purpureus TaxID=3225 RepID=A0A8T0IH94_CERPU|nr:hypothetical protein KC19_3G040900 [Ceratodon purpureus]KAG0621667.1 hypothetical protein M758_3G038900 [Ceratodon purpureus]